MPTPGSLLLLAAAVFTPTHARAAATVELWAAGDGDKIRKTDVEHPLKAKNAVWTGGRVLLTGGRNEVLGFQVLVGAPRHPVTIQNVEVTFEHPALRDAVEILSQHYLKVVTPTPDEAHGGWFWYAAAAPNLTGWIPDALVPLGAKPGKGKPPIAVPAGELQGFWADVAIPRDLKPGRYPGRVWITTPVKDESATIDLVVVDATLPDADLVKTMVYLSDPERRYVRKGPQLRDAFRKMAHRHRFATVEGIGFDEIESYKPYLTGEAFTPAKGYTGPGEGKGHPVFGISFYGAEKLVGDPEGWPTLDRWAEWFKANAPGTLPFIYLTDEPAKARWPWVKKAGDHFHRNPGPGGKLPVLVTMKPQPEVEGAVDIVATVADHVDLDALPAWTAKGRRWWFYNGMRPMSGAITTDAPAVDLRVQPWICWLNGVDLWFLWESTHWQHNHQGPRAHRDQNVWVDPITFAGGDVEVNGDGTLFYPGEDRYFPDQDRGIAGPISSIRMKNLRRGQQDLAWVALAIAKGREADARKIGKTLIPRSFSGARAHQPASWPQTGDPWDAARLELIRLVTGPATSR